MSPFLPTVVTLPHDAQPACAGLWELFDSTDPVDHEQAARLCVDCPVRETCAEIANNQRDTATGRLGVEGTWGGELWLDAKNVSRRARKANKRPPTADARCGTEPGYDAHRRRNEYPCDPCRIEGAAASRRRKSNTNAA